MRELAADAEPDTLAAWAATVMAAVPYLLASADSVRHELAASPHALATEAGRPVGVARIRDHVVADGSCSVLVAVRPEDRGLGTGSALLAWATERCARLGARRVTGIVDEDGTSPRVLAHWGFTAGDRHRLSWVDSRTVPAAAAELPGDGGLRLVALDGVDARLVWDCHQRAAPDDPSGFSRQLPFEEFLRTEWADPLLRLDLGRAVLAGGRCVAFSSLRAVGDRGWSSMTAVAPDHRGRGLSRAVKASALRAAAAAGVHRCATANAGTNRPVLALNARLGYQPLCTVRAVERSVAP